MTLGLADRVRSKNRDPEDVRRDREEQTGERGLVGRKTAMGRKREDCRLTVEA